MNTVFEEAKSQLVDKTKNNPEEYRSVLKNLMIQGFIKLLEENVNMSVTVDSKYHLPDTLMDGVFLTSLKSKIRVDNTLDKRLELLRLSATPEIRKILFEQA